MNNIDTYLTTRTKTSAAGLDGTPDRADQHVVDLNPPRLNPPLHGPNNGLRAPHTLHESVTPLTHNTAPHHSPTGHPSSDATNGVAVDPASSAPTQSTSSASGEPRASILRQPKAVWAVAFACVVSFMGFGLVDPILPAIAEGLQATPSQVSLLFTSYLVVTAVAMLGVGWFSSHVGAKWTLLTGLTVIVVFSALAGMSHTVNEIIGFRGGWGLGNALFVATSLAVIVSSARGGFSGAIILYEAALGLGFAVGPLVGGLLGNISWRGPFFGVAMLMFIGLVASMMFIPRMPAPERKIELGAAVKALRHRALLIISVMALLYNWGFFTLLGYAPYPMKLNALELGWVFTAWGLLVAAFAVFFAPRLQRRFGTARVLYANLTVLAVLMVCITCGLHYPMVVIVAVIISGACIGVNNTLTTQAVMMVAPVERSVASSAYGFVRFIGGGLSPFVAGLLTTHFGQAYAFGLGAFAFALAIPVLALGHKSLEIAEGRRDPDDDPHPLTAEQRALRPSIQVIDGDPKPAKRSIMAAIDGTELADAVVDRAAEIAENIAGEHRAPVELVHVVETTVVGEVALSPETADQARALLRVQADRLRTRDIPVRAILLTSIGRHGAVGHVLAEYAQGIDASAVVIGQSSNGALAQVFDADVANEFRGTPPGLESGTDGAPTRTLELVAAQQA